MGGKRVWPGWQGQRGWLGTQPLVALCHPLGAAVVRWLPAVPLLLLCRAQPLEGAESHMRWQQAVPCEHRQAPAAAGWWPRGHPLRGLRPGAPWQVEADQQRAHRCVLQLGTFPCPSSSVTILAGAWLWCHSQLLQDPMQINVGAGMKPREKELCQGCSLC